VAGFLKQYELLFKKAAVDLKAAQNLYSDFREGDIELDMEVVFFHLQQAAEKLIKALLSYNQVNFPKVHDLEELHKIIIKNHIIIHIEQEKLFDLGDYAVEGRYAVFHDDFEDAKDYIQMLLKLKDDVAQIILPPEHLTG
jgi:HEPN domain-containing protein